jgi:hypothetical protein
MFKAWANRVIWEYPAETEVDTLYRHQRWCVQVTRWWISASLLFLASLFEFLLSSEGWLRNVGLVWLCVTCGSSLLLTVPAIGAGLLLRTIRRVLEARRIESDVVETLDHDVAITAMKTCAWVAAILLLVHVLEAWATS